jgi:hypothetical protein
MSKFRALLLLTTVMPAVAACGADDIASPGEGQIIVIPPAPPPPLPPPPPPPSGPAADCPAGTTDAGIIANRRNCRLPSRISSSLALRNRAGTIYSIDGRVDVGTDVGGDGSAAGGQSAILSVDPGVVVFANSQATFLVVNRGSQLIAEGAANNPIIFTSRQNVEGTSTDASDNQWGGIIVLGRAPISNCQGNVPGGSAQCQQQVEGTNSPALYGGAIATDNSGSMRYVQIRYTGFSLAPNSELQGLTTAGVGSGTNIQFLQVHNSGDDGIEIFGGTHNLRNVVITGADDDTLDTDFGYKGFTQFLIGIQRPQAVKANTGDAMIEADSPPEVAGAADFTPRQNTRLANFTFVQTRTGRSAIHLRGGTDYALLNGVVVGPTNCLDVDQAETVQTSGPDEAGTPVIRSVAFSCPTFADPDADDFETTALNGSGNSGNNTSFTATLQNIFVNGANESGFTAANASSFNPFFTNANYVGAVRDANDIWYRGWTCDSGYVSFGSNMSCLTTPAAT